MAQEGAWSCCNVSYHWRPATVKHSFLAIVYISYTHFLWQINSAAAITEYARLRYEQNVRVSVRRLSVTRWYWVKTNNRRNMRLSPSVTFVYCVGMSKHILELFHRRIDPHSTCSFISEMIQDRPIVTIEYYAICRMLLSQRRKARALCDNTVLLYANYANHANYSN